MVYSTCTFNPIEDEAVVQTLLMDQDLSLELEELDLPLKGRPGMYSWKVGEHINASSEDEDVSIQWFASFDDAVRKSSSEFVKTMWPLDAPAHAEALRLELCARFLPHDDNTGGFLHHKKSLELCLELPLLWVKKDLLNFPYSLWSWLITLFMTADFFGAI